MAPCNWILNSLAPYVEVGSSLGQVSYLWANDRSLQSPPNAYNYTLKPLWSVDQGGTW